MTGKIYIILSLFLVASAGLFWLTPVQANNTATVIVKYQDQLNPVAINIGTKSISEAITYYQSQPGVEYAEALAYYQASMIPSDYYYNNQWYLKRIRADKAWLNFNESPDIVIAVIDSGAMTNHPDLKDNIWKNNFEIAGNNKDDDRNGYIDDINGWDFVNNVSDPSPKFKTGFTETGVVHGTVIAGIISASGNNNLGVTGVTWKSQLMILKALDDQGKTDTAKIVRALNYAIDNKANIINLSFIGPSYSRSVEDAIRRAYDAGIIVVAAGGNELSQGHGQDLDQKPMYPVCHDGNNGENMVIGVAATDPQDRKTSFSGFGKCIDIAAPGLSIYSTSVFSPTHNGQGHFYDNYYDGYWSGTSLAVPMVSASLALIQQSNPGLKPKEVIQLLLANTDNINSLNDEYSKRLGTGRLNLNNAIYSSLTSIKKTAVNLLLLQANGQVEIVNQQNKLITSFKVAGLNQNAQIASGDLNNDSQMEIIIVSGNKIKIYDRTGQFLKEMIAYDGPLIPKLSLAVGDVNNDGAEEIVIAPASPGRGNEIRIFSWQWALIKKFPAFANNFSGGVNLAVGDTNSNGSAEIIVSPASKGGPQVRIFNFQGRLLTQFFAADKNLRGNFQIEVASVYNSIKRESKIIFKPGPGFGRYLSLFDNNGNLKRRFAVDSPTNSNDILLTSADINHDGKADLISLDKRLVKIFTEHGLRLKEFELSSDREIPIGLATINITQY